MTMKKSKIRKMKKEIEGRWINLGFIQVAPQKANNE
jgi:hypothetical protein